MSFKSKDENHAVRAKKDFWAEYRNLVLKAGAPEKNAQWYLNWARQFARYIKERPLKKSTAAD